MSVCRLMLTSALTMLAKQGSADSKDDWRSFHFLRTLGRRNFQAQLKLDALFSPIGGPIFGTAFWRLFWGPCLNNSLAGSHFWFPIWDPKLAPRNCRKNDTNADSLPPGLFLFSASARSTKWRADRPVHGSEWLVEQEAKRLMSGEVIRPC